MSFWRLTVSLLASYPSFLPSLSTTLTPSDHTTLFPPPHFAKLNSNLLPCCLHPLLLSLLSILSSSGISPLSSSIPISRLFHVTYQYFAWNLSTHSPLPSSLSVSSSSTSLSQLPSFTNTLCLDIRSSLLALR